MILKKTSALICLYALLATPAAPEPAAESFTLANGMQVVTLPDRRAPVLTHMLWYRVGAADEQIGKSGLAHLFEHLMFKEAGNIPAGEFSRIIARNGGQDNAFTSQDYTAYFQRIARDRLPLVMNMEKTRMTSLRLSDEEVLPERNVVKEERRQRIGNNPQAQLYEKIFAALYQSHPYATPIIGHMHEVASLSRQDALDFYRRWYGPENAILIVAGDISARELRPLAQNIYGSIPRKENIERPAWPPVQELAASHSIIHKDPKIRQHEYYRVWLGLSATNNDRYALKVAMHLLGGGRTSLLFRKLVDEKKLAVSADAFSHSSSIARGYLGIALTPAPGISTHTLQKALNQELQHFLATGPDQKSLKHAKSTLIAQAVYARDSQSRMANLFGASLAAGMHIDDVINREKYLQAVSVQDVMRISRQLISNTHAVSAILAPEQDS